MKPDRRSFLKGIGVSAITVAGATTGVSAKSNNPNTVFDLDFSDPADAGDVGPNSAGWQVDRLPTGTWNTATFDGDERLKIGIDPNIPKGNSYFDFYQGKKYLPEKGGHWKTGYGTVLSYRFYIDPDWEGDGTPQQTGMWPVIADDSDTIVAYPNLEYQDSDASDTNEARFTAYSYEAYTESSDVDAANVDLGLPQTVDPNEGGWVDVEIRFLRQGQYGKGKGKKLKGGKLTYHVNGSLLFEDNGLPYYARLEDYGPPTQFFEPILNTGNFGSNEVYHYDDISLKEPGKNGKGKGK